MEVKVNGVMLRAVDYGENDKILTLLTAEYGKISASIRGVKKAGAKLKFAAQPFCFAEYILSQRGGRYTVIQASENESFYELRCDIDKFYASCAVIETANLLSYEGDEGTNLFALVVNALTQMCNGRLSDTLIEYLMGVLELSGYGIDCTECVACGSNLCEEEKLRFDFNRGAFGCWDCIEGQGVSRMTYHQLRKAKNMPHQSDLLCEESQIRALRLLREYVKYRADGKMNALTEYITMQRSYQS